jgi:hypothetical protein
VKRLNFQSYKAETLYDDEENALKKTTPCVAKLKWIASPVQNEQLLLLLVSGNLTFQTYDWSADIFVHTEHVQHQSCTQ